MLWIYQVRLDDGGGDAEQMVSLVEAASADAAHAAVAQHLVDQPRAWDGGLAEVRFSRVAGFDAAGIAQWAGPAQLITLERPSDEEPLA